MSKTTINPAKIVTSTWKPTSTVATIDVQDDEEIAIVADEEEINLPEDEIRNLFQDTSSEEQLETKRPQTN